MKPYLNPHRHRAIATATYLRPYNGTVAPFHANPAAHGHVCVVQTCRCGATRATNVNGDHVERGPWRKEDEQ